MTFEIANDFIASENARVESDHTGAFEQLAARLSKRDVDVEALVSEVAAFSVAAPSWALGAGGTRFGRFPEPGEPSSLEEKMDDVATLNRLTGANREISLHIPWDHPEDPDATRQYAADRGLGWAAINSNTFQDSPGQKFSYKFGSLCHTDPQVRQQAIRHNIDVIEIGEKLGCDAITIWLADGSSFPGQMSIRGSFERTLESLREIYAALPDHWQLFTEHKPFEPGFYATVVNDWGSSLVLARELGPKARCLVDLGHHLPNTSVEQVVARLNREKKLGGFHFNDSNYADDDLTTGSMKPYQLFLVFLELVDGMKEGALPPLATRSRADGTAAHQRVENAVSDRLAWMIDQSHNLKDPLEDLLQSTEAILIALAQALLVNREGLAGAQDDNDVTLCQEILQDAYRTDVRPLVAEARRRNGAAIAPLATYRASGFRSHKAAERGMARATGL